MTASCNGRRSERVSNSGSTCVALGSHAQSALEFDWQRELLEETGWVQIVLTRFVDHTDEIVRRRVWVLHYWIQLPDLERRGIAAIPESNRETLCSRPMSPHG